MNKNEYMAFLVNAQYKTWMVRRWTPPLTDEQLSEHQSGELKVRNSMYIEALISGYDTEQEAINAAIQRESWA